MDYSNDLDNDIDEFDTILPFRNTYKYTHLQQYKENEILELFAIELVLRYIEFHKILILEEFYDTIDGETDIEFETRVYLEGLESEEKLNKQLIEQFGLNTEELTNFFLVHPFNGCYNDDSSDMRIHIYCKNKTNILNIELDLNLSQEELISTIIEHKKNFDDTNLRSINLLGKVNDIYSDKIKAAFTHFPDGFIEKKKAMIDALFVFDYVISRQKEIGKLNTEIKHNYNKTKIDIINRYNKGYMTKETKEAFLKDAHNEYKDLVIPYPTKNTSSDNCYFKEEIFKLSKIPPGAAKKSFYIIQALISKTIQ